MTVIAASICCSAARCLRSGDSFAVARGSDRPASGELLTDLIELQPVVVKQVACERRWIASDKVLCDAKCADGLLSNPVVLIVRIGHSMDRLVKNIQKTVYKVSDFVSWQRAGSEPTSPARRRQGSGLHISLAETVQRLSASSLNLRMTSSRRSRLSACGSESLGA